MSVVRFRPWPPLHASTEKAGVSVLLDNGKEFLDRPSRRVRFIRVPLQVGAMCLQNEVTTYASGGPTALAARNLSPICPEVTKRGWPRSEPGSVIGLCSRKTARLSVDASRRNTDLSYQRRFRAVRRLFPPRYPNSVRKVQYSSFSFAM